MTFIEACVATFVTWVGLRFGGAIFDRIKSVGIFGVLMVLCLWLIVMFLVYMSFGGDDSTQPCVAADEASAFRCVEV